MNDWLKRVAAAVVIAAHESGDRPIDEILEAVRGSSS
jgi:hypothetical protein